MTSAQHARTLCIANLVYATGLAIVSSVVGWMLGEARLTTQLLLVMVTLGAMGPFVLTSYGVLHDRPWARAAGLVTVILTILSFPFGTTLAIYTLWYFFSDGGRKQYR